MEKNMTTYKQAESYCYEIREGDQLRGNVIAQASGFSSNKEAKKEGNKILRGFN